ncbi:MAG: acyl carrier protein [Deltaproteobacteria bacterium]|nr:acyl carrier protein [Deltaproteobacteria bacterium]
MTHPNGELFAQLAKLVKNELSVGIELTESTRVVGDLNLDSLQAMHLVAAVEDNFGVAIPMELLPNIKTLGDIKELISKLRSP